jgi:hypothetical protein
LPIALVHKDTETQRLKAENWAGFFSIFTPLERLEIKLDAEDWLWATWKLNNLNYT